MTARVLLLCCCAALAGCPSEAPAPPAPTRPPGLSAHPRWLTFQCIKPGCDTALKVAVAQEGLRRLVVKRIVLSDAQRTDFVIETAQKPPFPIEGSFDITVRHVPKPGADPGDVDLLVTYTDATADDSPDRVPPGELSIPLLRRLIGEPVMVATPGRVSFGAAWIGDTVTEKVVVENAGYGNVTLDVASVESDQDDVKAGKLPTTSLLPNEKLDLPLVFEPTAARFTRATLTIKASDPAVKPAKVVALATSLAGPRASSDPASVDFGEVPKLQAKTATLSLLNQGGAELTLSNLGVTTTDGNLVATLAGDVKSATLQPLESIDLTLKLTAKVAGVIDGAVTMTTNDNAAGKAFQVPVKATVTEPKATPTPTELDFGQVFKGWTKTQAVTVENTGYGDLKILGITLVRGSSELFTLRTLPILPATLKRGQRIAVEVDFRADAVADFTGAVSVESNDPNGNFLQVPLKAKGATCETACVLANAVPSCSSGTCAIQSCNQGWFNTDTTVQNGCECHDATDNGPFCADATNLGQMSDSHSSASYQGVLPVAGDEDTLRFTLDGHGWFSGHDIYVNLYSTDPTIQMCTSIRGGAECPTTQDGTTCKSAWSTTDEDATVLVKISRKTDAKPTCIPYTVTVSHF